MITKNPFEKFVVKTGRIVCFDTETTGLRHDQGHRVIEIGCVEIIDLVPTGRTFHTYLNPQRNVDAGSFAVHGLSDSFLKDKPLFKDIANDFINFLGDATLVIHNASFDMGFINNELKLNSINNLQNHYIDSVVFAKHKFPGSPVSLDALCKRFAISLEDRNLHGALIDADLLSRVYIKLCQSVEDDFFNNSRQEEVYQMQIAQHEKNKRQFNIKIVHPTQSEIDKHSEFFN